MYRSHRGFTINAILILIAANLVLYLAVLAHGQLVYTLGLEPASWLERPWTMVTNLFVHGGLWHVAANMITLFFFGRFLSALIGEARFLIIYFLGGIVGNLVYVLLASPYTIAIGASGAVFAVGGALAVMRPRLTVFVFPIPAPLPLCVAVAGGFVIISFMPHVAWQGHLGGLVLGLIAGYFFRKKQRIIIF